MDAEADRESRIRQYSEVCTSYHAIDSFRAKLLALLPFGSVLGGVVVFVSSNELPEEYLGPIGILGFVITLGLFVFELRGVQKCERLKRIACNLEQSLGLDENTGQFLGNPEPWLGVVAAPAASVLVYASLMVGWLYVAAQSNMFCA